VPEPPLVAPGAAGPVHQVVVAEPDPMPIADLPAGIDPDELVSAPPTSARRSRLRRRVAFLRAAREVLLRDLGGFVYELHRTAHDVEHDAHRRLRETKLSRLGRIDAELHELELILDDVRRQVLVREPGVGGECTQCGELFSAWAQFCSNCGLPLTESAQRRLSRIAEPPPEAEPVVAPDPVVGPAPVVAPAADQPTEEIPPLDPDHPAAGADFQWPRRETGPTPSTWTAEPSSLAGMPGPTAPAERGVAGAGEATTAGTEPTPASDAPTAEG
jgi:hypothetical protein